MDGISGINITQFDWGALADKINSAAPGTNVQDASFDPVSKNVTLTVSDNGATRAVTVELPDIDNPGVIDPGELDSFIEKLTSNEAFDFSDEEIRQIATNIRSIGAIPLPPATGNVLFDLYAILALMLECAQEQRDAAREIRQAENQAIQTAIQNQAAAQRSAALTGMIAGALVCAFQAGIQIGALVKSAQGFGQKSAAIKDSGVDAAHQKLKQTSETARKENLNLEKYDKVDALRTEHTKTKTELADAQAEVDTAKVKAETAEADVKTATTELSDAKANQAAKQKAYDEAVAGKDETKIKTAQDELDAANTKVEAAETKLSKAEGAQKVADAELNEANTKLEGAKTRESEAAKDVKQAENDYNETSDRKIDTITYEQQQANTAKANADNAEAQRLADNADAGLRSDMRYISGDQKQNTARTISDIVGAVGQSMQGFVRGAADLLSAEATEMGAEQKQAEEQLDQIRDLFGQAQEVINKVVQLSQSVIQAEAQSMQDAIHA